MRSAAPSEAKSGSTFPERVLKSSRGKGLLSVGNVVLLILEQPSLVFGGQYNMIDDKGFDRKLRGTKTQAKLFLNCGQDRRTVLVGRRGPAIVARPRQVQVVPSDQAGVIHDDAFHLSGQDIDQ